MIKRHLWVFITIVSFISSGLAQDDESSCVGCHLEQDEPFSTPAIQFADDIHSQSGFTCVACHGGDPEAWDYDEAKDPSTGFIGVPEGKSVIEVCGKCHSDPTFMRRYNPNLPVDQVTKYWTSGHGISLQKGNNEVAECASCHAAHSIKRANDPGSTVYHRNVSATCGTCHSDVATMSKFNLPSDIVANYEGSVHGVALLERGDIAAPTCNNCHGNHAAAPPEVGSVQEVCGTCHVNNQILFSQTSMHDVFLDEGIHGCEQCHTAHDIQQPTDEMLGTTDESACFQCHSEDDDGGISAALMYATLIGLADSLSAAEAGIAMAENKGAEVEELLLDLQSAHTALVQSRTMIHSFDAEQVAAEAQPGMDLATGISNSVAELIHGLAMRKIGLGISTLLISFLAFVLYLYVRQLDKETV